MVDVLLPAGRNQSAVTAVAKDLSGHGTEASPGCPAPVHGDRRARDVAGAALEPVLKELPRWAKRHLRESLQAVGR